MDSFHESHLVAENKGHMLSDESTLHPPKIVQSFLALFGFLCMILKTLWTKLLDSVRNLLLGGLPPQKGLYLQSGPPSQGILPLKGSPLCFPISGA